jgi:hypothetical protein
MYCTGRADLAYASRGLTPPRLSLRCGGHQGRSTGGTYQDESTGGPVTRGDETVSWDIVLPGRLRPRLTGVCCHIASTRFTRYLTPHQAGIILR